MSQVTPEAVWQAQLRDPEFAYKPSFMQEVIRPFVEALPTLLADKLDEQCTFAAVTEARFVFLKYCLENNFARKAADATPEEVFATAGLEGRDELCELISDDLGELLEWLAASLPELSRSLAARGLTHREYTLPSLNVEARQLYLNGELTMGQLLLLQPTLVTVSG